MVKPCYYNIIKRTTIQQATGREGKKMEKIYKRYAYEQHTGERHVFEAYRQLVGAPYVIMLDGSFLTTAESGREIADEIEETIKWYGWAQGSPVFA